MVDTGSAGWRNFEDFRQRVIDRVQTRLFALVNICGVGMTDTDHEQNPYDMDVDRTAACARDHEDVVVGIKTAHYYGPEWISVDRCLEAAARAETRVMIDFGFFKRSGPIISCSARNWRWAISARTFSEDLHRGLMRKVRCYPTCMKPGRVALFSTWDTVPARSVFAMPCRLLSRDFTPTPYRRIYTYCV